MKGTAVIVTKPDGGRKYMRNVSQIKKYLSRDRDEDSIYDNSGNDNVAVAENEHRDEDETDQPSDLRRSERIRNPPVRYGDAVSH